jgi:hypothetical protein
MERRELLGFLSAAGAAGLVMGGAARPVLAQGLTPGRYRSQLDKMHVDCLDNCTACAAVCNEASHHCLDQLQRGQGDREQHARAHGLAMDCATICATAATLISRMSPLIGEQCDACAEACRRCAEECAKDGDQAAIMTECARVCRECEKSCRAMASAHGGRTAGTR